VERNSDLLVRLESASTGKPLEVSRDDISSTVDTFRFFAGAARAMTSQAAADYTENTCQSSSGSRSASWVS
jgi:aminobutyraldehyde dehydrogenase